MDNPLFPFGQPIKTLTQEDRTPKKVFILGVYASAVHAKWLDANGKVLINALAVASEPYIFWRGENAEAIISQIPVPQGAGSLIPAGERFNGPSGRALDEYFLAPLKLERKDAWLCDLVPYSCKNIKQAKAIRNAEKNYSLTPSNFQEKPKALADNQRRQSILDEIKESQAEVLITLGDEPIKWFLSHFDIEKRKKLADFGQDEETYGKLHQISHPDISIKVLPLVHPRQAAKLGLYSREWNELHTDWVNHHAHGLLG
ncbi:uracil-DNA glycosylase family protein [Dehalococcoides mccartyi]|uniref:uracil-DNA glycosylase family protein n=1 Tax=Dehalococcoides mccartyi TaxID=61435 RepID=UPI00241E8086|nr:uracil-DNA glycosylase family protein [Dehalococcoides mccartyi]